MRIVCMLDLNVPRYQFLNKKREDEGIKHLRDTNTFREYSNTRDSVYNKQIETEQL